MGARLPQWAISGQIRQYPIRKRFWMVGGFGFGSALTLIALGGFLLPRPQTAWMVILLLAIRTKAGGLLALPAGLI
jgi:hypothetical protein